MTRTIDSVEICLTVCLERSELATIAHLHGGQLARHELVRFMTDAVHDRIRQAEADEQQAAARARDDERAACQPPT